MATATIDQVAAVVMTTADGESRPAEMWGQDSWTCAFCQTPTFGPADWEQHERDNAECYAKTGESYTWEPYADYRRGYWERRACSNPGCVSTLTGKYLEEYRKREADRLRREEDHARWQRAQDEVKLMAQLEAEAADAKHQRLAEQGPLTREAGEQLGFAWHCFAGDCETSGYDREEYAGHVKGHGKRALVPAFKRIKLRKVPAAAKFPPLEVNPFKWAHWEQSVSIYDEMGAFDHTETAQRRGQYLANGPGTHNVWVIPFEAAPWENGTAQPVLLYAGKAGRYFTDSYSAKYDRR